MTDQDKKSESQENKKSFSRRNFVKGAALTAASFMIVPRHVLGRGFTPPSDKLNIAGVGVGGMGRANLLNVTSENIVALCDVDWDYTNKAYTSKLDTDMERAQKRLAEATTDENRKSASSQIENFKRMKEQFPKAKQYKDYREMLDKQKDIDALIIATPDHTHAIIAMAGLKMSKHLYVQKPLTYTVHEARMLAAEAKKAKVITQMGNQGHSTDDARKINEWVADGAIGKVTEVHIWTNRPIWPQGVPKPTDTPPIPDTLSWDLFLGPAPFRPYHPAYTPFSWRGWVDFGVSAIGDMGAHLVDHPNWALKLGPPSSIEATSTPFGTSKENDKVIKESYPLASVIHYEFPARGDMPPVKLTWYDGGLMPPRPEEMAEGENMDKGGGVLFIGDKGKLMHETYGRNPRLLPKSKMESYKQPKPTIPRVTTSHEMDWVNACKNGKQQPSSNFDYAGPLTETMLLGVVATMVPGKKLLWDSANMKVTNVPEANEYIRRQYRQGWTLL